MYARADDAVPLVGVELVVRAGTDRQSSTQNGLAALVAETILRTPVPLAKTGQQVALGDAVGAMGGSLSYAVAPRYVRFYLEAPPDAIGAIAPVVARVLASPLYDTATLTAARNALNDRIGEDQKNPVLVGLEAVRTSYYRDGAGQPSLGTPATLSTLAANDARAFHDRFYLRSAAFITAVGQTGRATDGAARALVAALGPGTAPAEPPLTTRPFEKEPRRIVTRRDVFAPYVVLGFAAPPLADKDFAATLVMRSLLQDVFDSESATTPTPLRRSVGAIYGYDVAPAAFALWINGARLDPSTALGAIAAVLKGTAGKPLSASILERYKSSARGQWQLEATTLDERAWEIGGAVMLGLDPGTADTIPAQIDAVTAADVQRVAKRWFSQFDVALVLPRTGSGG